MEIHSRKSKRHVFQMEIDIFIVYLQFNITSK